MKTKLLHKAYLLTVFCLLTSLFINAQTTFTYSGSGDWTDTANWSPSYPGTTINTADTVIINGSVDIFTSITNLGTINNSGTLNILSNLDNSGSLTNTGTLDIDFLDNTGIITNSLTLNLSGFIDNNNGTITNTAAGTLTIENFSDLFNSGTITNIGTLDNLGTLLSFDTLDNSGTFNNSGTADILSELDNSGALTNTGTLDIDFLDNTGIITNSLTLNLSGFIDNNNGTITNTVAGTLTIENFSDLFNSGTITNIGILDNLGTLLNFDTIDNSGTLNNSGAIDSPSFDFDNSGTLTGINTSHQRDFNNAGVLSPGNSPGTYTFNDSYTHESTATLTTELESTTNFDIVAVTGTANLSGTLDVNLLNGFTPSLGDTFTILTAGTVSGTFATTNLPTGYTWSVNYSATEVVLEVIPNTFTYSDSGDWTDTANWSPWYPGTTINTADTVIINGSVDTFTSITNLGTINNSGTLNILSNLDNSGSLTNTGTLDIDFLDNTGIITNSLTLNLSGFIDNNNGTITNTAAGTLTIENFSDLFNSGTITNIGTLDNLGTLLSFDTLDNSGTFNNSGTADILSELDNSGALTNTGTLDIDFLDNTGIITNSLTLNLSGFIDNNNGTITNTVAGTLTIENFSDLFNSGTITNIGILDNLGTLLNFDTIDNSGTLNNLGALDSPSFDFDNSGTLTGINTSHQRDFNNAGVLSPGNSPGTYTFNDSYTHESTATLTTELESTTNFDIVAVTGTANLNGTLDVNLLNGFTPSLGDTFTILTAGTVSGTFATTNLPTGYTWSVNYSATEVILEVASTLSSQDFDVLSFSLYPNPAKDQFTIQLDLASKLEKVNIYNMLGQVVLTTKVTNIDSSNLASGSYFVEVITSKGKTTKKLILE
ncbi:T9SS type A sorting domain-containing protein [Psychroserpens burtonensis]|uniref:T9SS type A sorting domain-containing protein n=1 Tax=Psychroserpens burtonensis TaxID=49278 RepID=A0A5C7B5A0_9FLAO|nr:T9SS type A sorting domain-containing protein [Psychroserpens burtonensis]TXE15716.1 T9SS type A sorting domain-containing protein [Psychroserpens burtonensis]